MVLVIVLFWLISCTFLTISNTYGVSEALNDYNDDDDEENSKFNRELGYNYYYSHNNDNYCGVRVQSDNTYFNIYDLYITDVRFYIKNKSNSWEVAYIPTSTGMNLVKFASSGETCTLNKVGTYANSDSSSLIAAIDALTDGDIVVLALSDTGDGFSSQVISKLQARLGATLTSFSYRATYAFIAQYYSAQSGVSLCESGPTEYLDYTDAYYGNYSNSYSVCKHYFDISSNTSISNTSVPTDTPSEYPTEIPSDYPTEYPSATPTTYTTYIMSTIAGTGTKSYSGDDVAATSSNVYYPQGVAVDSLGRQMRITYSFSMLIVLFFACRQRVYR